jgi:hypothetical protein
LIQCKERTGRSHLPRCDHAVHLFIIFNTLL